VARNQASTAAQRAPRPGEPSHADLAGGDRAGRRVADVRADGSVPDLKSNTTMNQLSEELASTETRWPSPAAYNDAVMAYNTGARSSRLDPCRRHGVRRSAAVRARARRRARSRESLVRLSRAEMDFFEEQHRADSGRAG